MHGIGIGEVHSNEPGIGGQSIPPFRDALESHQSFEMIGFAPPHLHRCYCLTHHSSSFQIALSLLELKMNLQL